MASLSSLLARARRSLGGHLGRLGRSFDTLAEQEHIEVSDEELAQRVALIVSQSGRQREQAASLYSKEEHRAALRHAMRREKTLDFLLKRAQSEDSTTAEESGGEHGGGAEQAENS